MPRLYTYFVFHELPTLTPSPYRAEPVLDIVRAADPHDAEFQVATAHPGTRLFVTLPPQWLDWWATRLRHPEPLDPEEVADAAAAL